VLCEWCLRSWVVALALMTALLVGGRGGDENREKSGRLRRRPLHGVLVVGLWVSAARAGVPVLLGAA